MLCTKIASSAILATQGRHASNVSIFRAACEEWPYNYRSGHGEVGRPSVTSTFIDEASFFCQILLFRTGRCGSHSKADSSIRTLLRPTPCIVL